MIKKKKIRIKRIQRYLEDSAVVTDGGNDPDVAENDRKSRMGFCWYRSESGDTSIIADSGVDWDEMVQAISYATGIDGGNMTIYFLGNNGVNKSVGTVQG